MGGDGTVAAFTLAGVVIGVAITSAYNFWSVRRKELVAGSAASRALDDELRWLAQQLRRAVEGGRVVRLDATAAIAVWREGREDLVLWLDADTSEVVGNAFRACERWESEASPNGDGRLAPEDVDGAAGILVQIDAARRIVESLAGYLWSEHEVFILVTLFRATGRAIKRASGKQAGWQPPVPDSVTLGA